MLQSIATAVGARKFFGEEADCVRPSLPDLALECCGMHNSTFREARAGRDLLSTLVTSFRDGESGQDQSRLDPHANVGQLASRIRVRFAACSQRPSSTSSYAAAQNMSTEISLSTMYVLSLLLA